MEYFELFNIPVQLKLDRASLQPKFIEMSRKYHPDYHAQQDASMQMEALQKSATLNKAWKTFQSVDETIRYVLLSKGLMEAEEKYELPPDFLMEVLEINEQLMDADEPAQRAGLLTTIDNMQREIYEPVETIVEGYEEGITPEASLLRVKEYYYKKKYLDRLRRELAGKA